MFRVFERLITRRIVYVFTGNKYGFQTHLLLPTADAIKNFINFKLSLKVNKNKYYCIR